MMHLPVLFLLVEAACVAAQSASTYSQQFCRTQLRPQQGGGGTTTKSTTLYFTQTVRSVVTPTTTVTPKGATVITKSTVVKSTTKTLPRTTNTFSTTLSFTQTSTVSTTLISTSMPTSTEVVTSSLDTTTIAASAGSIPLSSALAASGHTLVKRRRSTRDRIGEAQPALVEERAGTQKIICGSDGSITYNPPQYWGAVTCYKMVQVVGTKVITSTAKTTKTITAPRGTVTQTSFITTTTTLTETPIAASTTTTSSTTQTVTSTSTILSTTIIPITTTSTSFLPQPTAYAACAQDNIVSFVDNQRIFNIVTTDPDNGFSFGNATTDAYSCCVQCVQNGNCGGSTYHPASGTCYFFPLAGATCDATADSGSFSTQTGSNVGFVVSNSNCGEVHLA